MKLSLLVPTLLRRVVHQKRFFNNIIEKINNQIQKNNLDSQVEVLSLLDNNKMTIGEKRNHLLSISKGLYVNFIDDDDDVTDNYIVKILEAINSNNGVDVITYHVINYVYNQRLIDKGIKHKREIFCRYGLNYEYTKLTPWSEESMRQKPFLKENWFGLPSHTMVWRGDLARSVKFANRNAGEDFDWVKRICPLTKSHYEINEVLYYYNAVSGKNY